MKKYGENYVDSDNDSDQSEDVANQVKKVN